MCRVKTLRAIALSFALVLGACANEETRGDYEDDWGAGDFIAPGAADGIIDDAPDLTFGTPVTGSIGTGQMSVYALDLQAGDGFMLQMEVTSGDLEPHVSLYWGTNTYIHSRRWNREGNLLQKWYEAENTGTYFVAARAYRDIGTGDYRLTAICEAGPCNGDIPEPPDPDPLTAGQAAECIDSARRCAYTDLSEPLTQEAAQEKFDNCIAAATVEDADSCSTACEFTGRWDDESDAAEICRRLVDGMVFYSAASNECRGTLGNCLGECLGSDMADEYYDDEEFYYTPIGICWYFGFNGNCDSYARSHETCGGERPDDSAAECFAFCESTVGAFIDDLDCLCDDECDYLCNDMEDRCMTQCEDDSRCFGDCMERLGPSCNW